jgi:hypothetical protein
MPAPAGAARVWRCCAYTGIWRCTADAGRHVWQHRLWGELLFSQTSVKPLDADVVISFCGMCSVCNAWVFLYASFNSSDS